MENKLGFNVVQDDGTKIDFMVVSFEGQEAISQSYEFKIQLRSKNILDARSSLGKRGILTIEIKNANDRKSQTAIYHGIIIKLEGSRGIKSDNYNYYEVTITPKLAKLKYSKKSDVFVQSGLQEILRRVFQEHMLADQDQKIMLSHNDANYQFNESIYNRYSYVCQYEESDYDFVNRLLERDGVYYYFEQGENQEQLIITDTNNCYMKRREGSLYLRTRSDQSVDIDPNAIDEIKFDSKLIPKTVIIKNFCYQKADKGERQDGVITVSQLVNPGNPEDASLIGEEVIYGENFVNGDMGINGDGEFIAKVRAEEIYCRKLVYTAKSSALPISAGMRITINDNDPVFGGDYLVIKVQHQGYQQIPELKSDVNDQMFYTNILTLISAKIQFRPERKTPWPRVYGTISAFIDGEGDNESGDMTTFSNQQDVIARKQGAPELNEFGCYKVRLPFLKIPKAPGRESIWLRLATPYAGDGHGLHFPLYKGTEVMLSFRNGDPDLPVIMAAVFNSTHKNVLNTQTAQNGGGISTRENSIFFNDAIRKIESCSDGSWHTL